MYDENKNRIMFERAKNWAVAFENLCEEAARIKQTHSQTMKPGGTPHEDYVDTDIATTSEFDTFISMLTETLQFRNGDGPSDAGKLQVARWGWSHPFVNTTPA